MESWERIILKWWVDEGVSVKWAINERSKRKEIRKYVITEAMIRREIQDYRDCQQDHCSPDNKKRKVVVSDLGEAISKVWC